MDIIWYLYKYSNCHILINIYKIFNDLYYICQFTDARDGGLDLSADEILADGIIFRDKKSPKDRLEVTIGDGMEFTIHGTLGSTLNSVTYSLTFFFRRFQN